MASCVASGLCSMVVCTSAVSAARAQGAPGNSLDGATPESFELDNQDVTVTFPAGSVSGSFEVQFSTEAVPASTQEKLRFRSVDAYLGRGVRHITRVNRDGTIVKTTTYGPNAVMLKPAGTMHISLKHVAPGDYTLRLRIAYQRTVVFQGRRVVLPDTSTLSDEITVDR
jgi:hypothetical protein